MKNESTEVTVTSKQFYEKLKDDWLQQSGLAEGDYYREISFAIQHMHKNPFLQKCTQVSVLRAVINLAQVGLTLNPISKLAYLVPRYNRSINQLECVLEPDYRGLVKLLTDSGSVKSVAVNIIYQGDDAEVDMATEQKVIKHVPYFLTGRAKGEVVAVYSLAVLPDGSRHFEAMSIGDIDEIRDRSESYKAYAAGKTPTCIWVTDKGEMCRKTVLKRHTKYLPKSNAMEKLDTAIELDNQLHGFREEIDYGMLTFLESLIENSTFDPEKKLKMLSGLGKLQYKDEAFKLIDNLKEHQPIIGRDQTPHGMKEINQAVKNAADLDDFKERNK